VILDLFGLEPGTYTVKPEVDIPEREIEIRSIQPSAVTVTISQTVPSTTSLLDGQLVAAGQVPLSGPPPVRPARVPTNYYPMSWGAIASRLPELYLERRGFE